MRRALIAVGLLSALVTAGAAQAGYRGSNGRIAFDRADGHIYSVKTDGTGLTRTGGAAAEGNVATHEAPRLLA